MINNLNVVIVVINAITFLTFGYDKLMALKKGRRVPEIFLFTISLFFGACGAFLGMCIFNHKINKNSFRVFVPLLVFANYFLYIYVSGLL